MKMKKIFSVLFAGLAAISLTGCADDLVNTNTDPANVTKTLPEGLLAAAINDFQPNDYLIWFYNVKYFNQWSQMCGGSYSSDYTGQTENGGQGSQYIATLNYRNKIQQYIDETGKVENNGFLAATGIMTIYLAIFDTDMYGSIPYTEAGHYDDKGILTPKYEKVEDLYNLWIEELNKYITMLQAGDLVSFKAQDAAYGCDWKKWAKFANTLKLKIATRLYNNEPEKAMQLVEEAASNAAGLMTSTDDDFLFCKATAKSSGNDDYVYGTGNGILSLSASRNVMNFMLGAKDPRVRFIYTKNSFNSSVVQAFINEGRYDDLPSEVKANVIRDKDGNFEKWGGMGEPWVRYTSVPIVLEAKAAHAAGKMSDEDYEEYYNSGLRYEIKYDDDHVKDYSPFSYYSTEMRKGRDDFQLPTAMTKSANGSVDMHILQDTEDNPLYSMYMTAGEVNLYLAEFACLKGSAIAGKTYQEWYYAGVRASVEEYDKLAKSNKIPYYYDESNPGIYDYDKFERSIALQKGEIDTMLATDNVKLTGYKSADLEKIYLQLMMHFSEQPDDQYVTARRSGYPKVGSKLLPYKKFDGIALSAIPRRFVVTEPTVDDIMHDIVMKAYEEEGFKTFGTNSQGVQYNGGNAPLNVERVWPDKNAPQWGTPKE